LLNKIPFQSTQTQVSAINNRSVIKESMMKKLWKIEKLVSVVFFVGGFLARIKYRSLFFAKKTLIMPLFKEIDEGRVEKRSFLQRLT
jgi:hypothetical protein